MIGEVKVNAQGGADRLVGTAKADVLDGGAGDDVIIGGAGKDHLIGGEGRDQITGNDEGNVIEGGAGADRISGGAGDDLYLVRNPDDLVGDQITDSGGYDVLRYVGTGSMMIDGLSRFKDSEEISVRGSG